MMMSLFRHHDVTTMTVLSTLPSVFAWISSAILNDFIWSPKWHDDVIKWKPFPRYWTFVRGIHRSPVNSPYKGQWRGALMFSLICTWINSWVKKSRGWWFETPSGSLWRQCNGLETLYSQHKLGENLSNPVVFTVPDDGLGHFDVHCHDQV